MRDEDIDTDGRGHSIQIGRAPPADPKFYLAWGQENAKAFLQNANAALGQLLTVSTTLLGGTIAFWNYFPIDLKYRFVALAAALFTVSVCLFSAMPRQSTFDVTNAGDIRRHMEDIFAYKAKRLMIAKWSLVTTILVMIAGLILTTVGDRISGQTVTPSSSSTNAPPKSP